MLIKKYTYTDTNHYSLNPTTVCSKNSCETCWLLYKTWIDRKRFRIVHWNTQYTEGSWGRSYKKSVQRSFSMGFKKWKEATSDWSTFLGSSWRRVIEEITWFLSKNDQTKFIYLSYKSTKLFLPDCKGEENPFYWWLSWKISFILLSNCLFCFPSCF